jgi:3-hydroxyacyl-CoA dehydrogenase
MADLTDTRKVAIVGSGLIGRSWAMVFARGGYNVCLYDVLTEQMQNAFPEMLEKLKFQEKAGWDKEQLCIFQHKYEHFLTLRTVEGTISRGSF